LASAKIRNAKIPAPDIAPAIGLKRVGLSSEIVEINPHWTVAGLGIGLGGPALRALKMIGVLDQCVERGFGYSFYCRRCRR
jgi:2-polyprenyl-6-methoxyphenol hydroxylase-like FAD-dependent oxidoreductase